MSKKRIGVDSLLTFASAWLPGKTKGPPTTMTPASFRKFRRSIDYITNASKKDKTKHRQYIKEHSLPIHIEFLGLC